MLASHDFLGINMPQERGHLSCRLRATSRAAFGVGEVLFKCHPRSVGWVFSAMGFLFLHLEGEVCEWKGISIIRY